MRKVFLTSLLIILVSSCSVYQGPVDSKKDYNSNDETVENTVFATIGEEHVFRAEVKVFKKELSGMLIVKRMNEEEHRIVLTSDFGNTLFDFSIYKDGYKANYVMPDLNKKIVLNMLAHDFGYLIRSQYQPIEKAVTESQIVYKSKEKKGQSFIIVNTKDKEVREVIYSKTYKPKVRYKFGEEVKGIIEIEHLNLPLNIKLIPIDF